MNIYGIGVDIIDNNRVKNLIKKKTFLNVFLAKRN